MGRASFSYLCTMFRRTFGHELVAKRCTEMVKLWEEKNQVEVVYDFEFKDIINFLEKKELSSKYWMARKAIVVIVMFCRLNTSEMWAITYNNVQWWPEKGFTVTYMRTGKKNVSQKETMLIPVD